MPKYISCTRFSDHHLIIQSELSPWSGEDGAGRVLALLEIFALGDLAMQTANRCLSKTSGSRFALRRELLD
jgi:hypothetical protein